MKIVLSLLIVMSGAFAATASLADNQPPTTPQLSFDVYSDNIAELFWSRASDDNVELIYELKRDGLVIFRGDALSFMDTELTPGVGNAYVLTVVGKDGLISEPVAVQFDTAGDTFTPDAGEIPPVTGLRADVYSTSAAELFWDRRAEPNVLYVVTRNDEFVGETAGTSLFIDSNLEGQGTVIFDVYAVKLLDSEEVLISPPVSIEVNMGEPVPTGRPNIPALSAPQNISLTTYSVTAAELFWDRAPVDQGIVGTEILRNGDLIGTALGNSFYDSTRVNGQEYVYELVAINNLGERSTVASYPVASEPLDVIDPEYFKEVALNAEFGNSFVRVRKWRAPIKYVVLGDPGPELVDELARVVAELNELIDVPMVEVFDQNEANLPIYFGSGEFYAANLEPNARDLISFNNGLVWIYWNSNVEIVRGSIYIDTVRNTDVGLQKHVVREEVTQSLGLLNDSFKYPDSIFYQNPSRVTELSRIDRNVISTLYNPALLPGMTEAEVDEVLARGLGNP